jgi:hypothetical protein
MFPKVRIHPLLRHEKRKTPFRVDMDLRKTGRDWFSAFSRLISITMTKQPDLLILKLIEKLHDGNPITRRNAAGALRLQGSRAVVAIPAISALLADEDPRVRSEAERAIDHLRLGAA